MFGIVNLAIGNTAYTDDSIHPVITDLQDFIGSESFDAGLGEFASYVVSGEDWIWIDSDGNPPGCAFFDAYQGNQDAYLVSNGSYIVPDTDGVTFKFDQKDFFEAYYELHELLITDNFTGDPNTTAWTRLYEGVAGTSWETIYTNLEAYRGIGVSFAFHYVGNYADQWKVDNIDIVFLDNFTGSETFDADLGQFANYSVEGRDWIWIDIYGNPSGSAYFDEHQGDHDAYLVSDGIFIVPDIDGICLNFDQHDDYYDNIRYELHEVLLTEAFTGDPTTTNWTVLYEGDATCFGWERIRINLEAYRDIGVTFAFHYVGDFLGDRWVIDNVIVSVPDYVVECPPGGIDEGEPDCGPGYIDQYNCGCSNENNPIFQPINNGDTICGASGMYVTNNYLYCDTDWFEFTPNRTGVFNFGAVGEFPIRFYVYDAGSGDCSDETFLASSRATPEDTARLSITLYAGVSYWFCIFPTSIDSDYMCSVNYVAWLVGDPACDHDVLPINYVSPNVVGQVNNPITPTVTFKNRGTVTETFDVRLIIEHNGNEVYNETEIVYNLQFNQEVDVIFLDFIPDEEGTFTFSAISELGSDENPANDVLDRDHQAYLEVVALDFEYVGFFESSLDWEWGVPSIGPRPHSGEKLWATKLHDNYSCGLWMVSSLFTPTFNLHENSILGFWHWYSTESDVDGGNIKISSDGGVNWDLIYPDGSYDNICQWYGGLRWEPFFSGHHREWRYVTFDLSDYAGESVDLRIDFGVDGSISYPGWYIDDFAIINGSTAHPCWISGVVSGNSSGVPIEGAVVQCCNASDTTGPDGVYILEVYQGIYPVTAFAEYYNPMTFPDVVVEEDDTTYLDFALLAPSLEINDDPINVQMRPNEIETIERGITNTGDGVLEFRFEVDYLNQAINAHKQPNSNKPPINRSDVEVNKILETIPYDAPSIVALNESSGGEPPMTLDLGDEVFFLDAEHVTGDYQLLGVVFALDHFWVSGGNSGQYPNYLYKINREGLLVGTFDQETPAGWGWFDLAWDGRYIYGVDHSYTISMFDPDSGRVVGTIPNPSDAACIAIAYDPTADHFWGVKWWGSDIIEFDRNGVIYGQYPQAPLYGIAGIAWDNISIDGPWLWAYSQEEPDAFITMAQFDPINHCWTGLQFSAVEHSPPGELGDVAGGLEFTTEWDNRRGLLVCLTQGLSDWIGIYEITNWLSINPSFGTINPGETQSIQIRLDMTNIDDTINVLEAEVDLLSNSADNPSIDVHVDLQVGIEGEEGLLPSTYNLEQNYPNPFNSRTIIDFALPKTADVDLSVYNLLGQRVATLVSGKMIAGYHRVNWDARSISSGIYFIKIKAEDYTKTKKMLLLK